MATIEEIRKSLQEGTNWVMCLHCLHIKHTLNPMATMDDPCTQCGDVGHKKHITISEVTHCLRRQLPRSVKQYTMKATKKAKHEGTPI